MVKAEVTKGKKIGSYTGRVAVRATGSFNIQTSTGLVQGVSHRYCTVVQRGNGYGYSLVAKTDVRGTPPQHRDASSRALPPRPEGRGFTRKLMNWWTKIH
jgi:hypothetical protein